MMVDLLTREAGLSRSSLEDFRMLIKMQRHKVAEKRPQLQAGVCGLVLL